MKKILRDIPSSLLLILGMVLLLYICYYGLSYIKKTEDILISAENDLYKYTEDYYLYEGNVEFDDHGGIEVEGAITDIKAIADILADYDINISFHIGMPLNDAYYRNGMNTHSGETVDVLLSHKEKVCPNDKLNYNEKNVLFLSEEYEFLNNNGKISTTNTDYNVKGMFNANVAAVIDYNTLDENALKTLETILCFGSRVRVRFMSDKKDVQATAAKAKEALEAKGYTLLATEKDTTYNSSEVNDIINNTIIYLVGIIFSLITMYILLSLWVSRRLDCLAVKWCLGAKRSMLLLDILKESSILYLIAAGIYAIIITVTGLITKNVYILPAIIYALISYILYIVMLDLYYEKKIKKLNMIEELAGQIS